MQLANRLWKTEHSNPDLKFIFLHGLGGTAALWRPVAAELEGHAEVYAFDQRGHGGSRPVSQSSLPGAFSPLAFGQDLVETLAKLEAHPSWVVGHSMGVRSACALAYLKPEWVRGLVLIDLGFSGPAGGGLGETLARFVKTLPAGFRSRAEARDYLLSHAPEASIGQYLLAVLTPVRPGTAATEVSFPFDPSALIATIESAQDSTVRPWLEALASKGMPILSLRGATSGVWSHEEFLDEQKHFAQFPSVRFVEMEGCGHGLPFEKRKEFVALLREFCR